MDTNTKSMEDNAKNITWERPYAHTAPAKNPQLSNDPGVSINHTSSMGTTTTAIQTNNTAADVDAADVDAPPIHCTHTENFTHSDTLNGATLTTAPAIEDHNTTQTTYTIEASTMPMTTTKAHTASSAAATSADDLLVPANPSQLRGLTSDANGSWRAQLQVRPAIFLNAGANAPAPSKYVNLCGPCSNNPAEAALLWDIMYIWRAKMYGHRKPTSNALNYDPDALMKLAPNILRDIEECETVDHMRSYCRQVFVSGALKQLIHPSAVLQCKKYYQQGSQGGGSTVGSAVEKSLKRDGSLIERERSKKKERNSQYQDEDSNKDKEHAKGDGDGEYDRGQGLLSRMRRKQSSQEEKQDLGNQPASNHTAGADADADAPLSAAGIFPDGHAAPHVWSTRSSMYPPHSSNYPHVNFRNIPAPYSAMPPQHGALSSRALPSERTMTAHALHPPSSIQHGYRGIWPVGKDPTLWRGQLPLCIDKYNRPVHPQSPGAQRSMLILPSCYTKEEAAICFDLAQKWKSIKLDQIYPEDKFNSDIVRYNMLEKPLIQALYYAETVGDAKELFNMLLARGEMHRLAQSLMAPSRAGAGGMHHHALHAVVNTGDAVHDGHVSSAYQYQQQQRHAGHGDGTMPHFIQTLLAAHVPGSTTNPMHGSSKAAVEQQKQPMFGAIDSAFSPPAAMMTTRVAGSATAHADDGDAMNNEISAFLSLQGRLSHDELLMFTRIFIQVKDARRWVLHALKNLVSSGNSDAAVAFVKASLPQPARVEKKQDEVGSVV